MKTRGQLDNELYQIVSKYGDLRVVRETLRKVYPRSHGMLSRISNNEYEKVIPKIKEAYERNKID